MHSDRDGGHVHRTRLTEIERSIPVAFSPIATFRHLATCRMGSTTSTDPQPSGRGYTRTAAFRRVQRSKDRSLDSANAEQIYRDRAIF
jgi:hypothetical protein